MGKPQKQRSYQYEYEPDTAVQHRQNLNPYNYSWDEPLTNNWNSYSSLPNRYPNGFSQQQQHQHVPTSSTHDTLQLTDIHRLPISRNNNNPQSSSYNDNNGYSIVAASHINTNPNMLYSNIQQGGLASSDNNSMEVMARLGSLYENSYTDPVIGNDISYIPPDPLIEYINYFSNDYLKQGHQTQPYGIGKGDFATAPSNNLSHSNRLDSREEFKPIIHSNHGTQASLIQSSKMTVNSSDAIYSSHNTRTNEQPKIQTDVTYRNFSLSVPYLSNQSLTYDQLISLLTQNANHVIRRYLPHVHFLISCQQKLRDAVNTAQEVNKNKNKKVQTSYADFYTKHVQLLPSTFYERFKTIIPNDDIDVSYKELSKLVLEVSKVQNKGFEAMKTSLLGGMRDGQSWGLRQWMSKNGGALKLCNDLEMIMEALQKLPMDSETTIRVAKNVRSTIKMAYESLVNDVPKSYQAVSPAHPYLPFFHRLESVLKGLATFDPEDDDVICLGDTKPAAQVDSTKKTQETTSIPVSVPVIPQVNSRKRSHDDDDDLEDEANQKEAKVICLDDSDEEEEDKLKPSTSNHVTVRIDERKIHVLDALKTQMMYVIDGILKQLDCRVQNYCSNFWDIPENYTFALQLFRDIITHDHAYSLIQAQVVTSTCHHEKQLYDERIIHPISLYDIAFALSDKKNACNGTVAPLPGFLTVRGMEEWNMLSGKELIEAIDVVFLNAMTCATVGSAIFVFDEINSLRNAFWDHIQRRCKGDPLICPTKRSADSSLIRGQP